MDILKRSAIAAVASLLVWHRPAGAQSVFVDPGESALMLSGASASRDHARPARIGSIAGSVRGGVDLFLSVGPSDVRGSGAAGISLLTNRSRPVIGSVGAGVAIARTHTPLSLLPETEVAPFVGVSLCSIVETGRWRVVPEVGGAVALSIGTGDVPVVSAGAGIALAYRIWPRVAVVVGPEYVLADRISSEPSDETRHSFVATAGLMISNGKAARVRDEGRE